MPTSPSPEHCAREYQHLRLVTPKSWCPGTTLLPPPRRRDWAGQVGAALLVFSLTLLVLAFVGCSAALPASKVLAGAQTVLDGLCEPGTSAHLEMARDLLERGDLRGASEYLRSELVQNGHQRDVAALLSLIESQIPEALTQ